MSRSSQKSLRFSKWLRDYLSKIGSTLHIYECIDLNSQKSVSEAVRKCLERITEEVKKMKMYKLDIDESFSNLGKCFLECLPVIRRYNEFLKSVDILYKLSVKSITSLGDSVISENESPKRGKRIIRHLDVDVTNEIFTIHFVRIGIAISLLKDLMICLTKRCDVNDLREISKIMQNFLIHDENDRTTYENIISRLIKWCSKYNICPENSNVE